MRGIQYEIPNEWGNYLYKIFEGIDMSKYVWKIYDDETYVKSEESFLFEKDCYNNEEFLKKIRDNEYYVVFICLRAFPAGSSITEIKTYNDFYKSDCELVLLASDCSYVDIYVKSQAMLDMLYINAKKYNFTDIEFITDENDARTRLNAL